MSEINSTRLIADAERRFKELERKGWDWASFYNGWLECFGEYLANSAPSAPEDVREISDIVEKVRVGHVMMDEFGHVSPGFKLTKAEAAALIQDHYAPKLAALREHANSRQSLLDSEVVLRKKTQIEAAALAAKVETMREALENLSGYQPDSFKAYRAGCECGPCADIRAALADEEVEK